MPKGIIEVIPTTGKPFEVSIPEAKALVANGHGKWSGPRKLLLVADRNQKVTWKPMQSGYAGPLVMQVVT